MRRRPWSLIILAVFHFLAPVGNIVFNAVISKKDISEYFQMALSSAYLSKNWIMIVTPIIAGLAIYACKKWSFYAYLLSITVLFVFGYFGFLSKDGSLGFGPLIGAYLVNISVVMYFLVPAVRSVYFDRRMRWWEIKPRYNCDYQAKWQFEDNDVIHPGVVGNISENGLFLKSEIMPRDQDMVLIEIPFKNQVATQFLGQVIFHKTAGKIGFGVQFEHNKESKKMATEIIALLESQGQRINTLDIRPEDSLSFWVRQLITTGKGLFPKKMN